VLEIDHLNNYVLLKNEVVAFSHHVSSNNKKISIKLSKKKRIGTFLSLKSSKVNNISRSQRDFPKVFTDEPNGRQTVSTKILPNASIKQNFFIISYNKSFLHLQQVMQQKNEDEYRVQLILFFAKNNEFDH
jgi:hypothetical protein